MTFTEPSLRRSLVSLATPLGRSFTWYRVKEDNKIALQGLVEAAQSTVSSSCQQASTVEQTPTGWTLDGASVFLSADECLAHLGSATPLQLQDYPPGPAAVPSPGQMTYCWHELFHAARGRRTVEIWQPPPYDTPVHDFWKALPECGNDKVVYVAVDTVPRRCVRLTLGRPMWRGASLLRMETPEGTSTASYWLETANKISFRYSFRRRQVALPSTCGIDTIVEQTPTGWLFGGANVFSSPEACQAELDSAIPLPRAPSGAHAREDECWDRMFSGAGGLKTVQGWRTQRRSE